MKTANIQFPTVLQRGDVKLEINVSASIDWTNCREDLTSGFVASNIVATQAIVPIELSKEEMEQLKEEAIKDYLLNNS